MISEWIDTHGEVTPAQESAIQNMARGVKRWLHQEE